MVYVGKLTRPYLDREMVEFFRSARELEAGLAFLVVTQSPPETILDEFARSEIPDSDFRVTEAPAERVGSYLAEADFAICFCRPTLPLIAASPTKIGEYLTAGLPVVSSPGLGDVGALIADREVGAVVDDFSEAAYAAAARRLQELARDQQAAERCRRVAEEEFSLSEVGVPRYHELYCRVARTSRDEGLLPR
jgi:glycosyltransferase involved in cell wall biosynthesis